MSIQLERPGLSPESRDLRQDLVERASKLVPLLAANAQRTEDERKVVEENIQALEDAGLFEIMRPKRYGGLETDFRTKMEVTRELARGCGSTSWASSLMNICSWFTALWGEQAQDDVWGENPNNRIAGVFAPSGTAQVVDGGYIVSGKWPYASGCLHSQWALVGIPIVGDDGQLVDQGLVLIPMSDITIEDTWFVVGMKGTGSNTIVAEDVFVPAHRYVSVLKFLEGDYATPFKDEALYRAPFAAGALAVLPGPQLGLAQAALDLVLEKAPNRNLAYTIYEKQTQSPSFLNSIAKAASLVDSAHLHAYRAAADIDNASETGIYPDMRTRARIRMDMVRSVYYAREAIRELVTLHGAGSFAEVNTLQRIWRDSEVGSRHAVGNPEIAADIYGRALLDIPEMISPIV